MSPPPPRLGVIAFGSFQLDPATGVLRKEGVRLRLARQPGRILTILAQRSGDVVSREELREQIWGDDTYVDFEHGLNAAVNKLRQALGDSAEKPRFIETLPGRGYRFLAAVHVEEAAEPITEAAQEPPPALAPGPNGSRRKLTLLGGALLASAALVILGWISFRSAPGPRRFAPSKFTIPVPPGTAFQPSGARQSIAVSPDGSRVAFTTLGDNGELRLWLRDLAELEPKEIQSARGLNSLFWSPLGDALFFGTDRSLRRVPPNPGASWQIISDLPKRVPPSGTWLSPDRILLSNRQLTVLVPTSGGKPEVLSEAYIWPQVLPGGKQLLYLVYDSQIPRFRLRVGPFGDRKAGRDLLETDSRVTWVASTETSGASYLLYVRAGSLLAQRFDLPALKLIGEPVALATNVHVFQPTGATDFSVSENGVLVYEPLLRRSRIAWVDRTGSELQQVGPDNLVTTYVRASPDGRKVAASVHNPEKTSNEIWVYDTQSKVARVVVPGPGIMDKPVWSPDGSRLIYGRAVGSGPKMRIRGVLQPDHDETLPDTDFQLPTDWSPDGRFTLFQSENSTDGNIGVVDLRTRKLTWLLETAAHETSPVFSPDGKSIAFISNDSGQLEAYAQAFEAGDPPRLTGERVRFSTQGAQLIRWRADGKEICYLGLDGMMYSVPVKGALQFETPTPLFRVSLASRAVLPSAFGFDVSADGSRFLLPLVTEPLDSHLVVVQGWESFLTQR